MGMVGIVMTNRPDTIDSIIEDLVYPKVVERGIGGMEKNIAQAKAALSAMVAEIIGKDHVLSMPTYPVRLKERNELRDEQRQRAIAKGFNV